MTIPEDTDVEKWISNLEERMAKIEATLEQVKDPPPMRILIRFNFYDVLMLTLFQSKL